MIRRLMAKLRRQKTPAATSAGTDPAQKFTGKLAKDEKLLRYIFDRCDDVRFRNLTIPALGRRAALLVYTEGMVNEEVINRDIIYPLLHTNEQKNNVHELIAIGQTSTHKTVAEVEMKVLHGFVLLLIDGNREGVMIPAQQLPSRAIEEPNMERGIRGPRDGFVEVSKINLSLIRRRLPTPHLKAEQLSIGRRSNTNITLIYLSDVAEEDTVNEVRERLNAIDIDGVLEPGALSELITERTITPFPLILSTERPDKVSGALLEGKVAIMSDLSPFALIMPVTFADFYQTPEDYYMNPILATAGRLLRFISLFISTTASAAYLAVITFHYEMIPRDIVVFIAEGRAAVPFHPFAEALLLEFAVELIREASLRMPGTLGPTIGIVGALILGQSAVNAQLVSPVMLIIVAISLMANFTIPNYEAALTLRYIRFPIIILAGFL